MERLVVLLAAILAILFIGGCATPTVDTMPMKTDVQRFTTLAEVKPELLYKYRALNSKLPPGVAKAMKFAHLRNCTVYLKKIAESNQFILFNYIEYSGRDFRADLAGLADRKAYAQWRKECEACLITTTSSTLAWMELEPIFFTTGAADVVPTPAKYARVGMITGLKAEKEAEYRMLHASAWPGVLKGIKDGNLRNFSIHVGEVAGKLYLFGYLEYVGTDGAADDAKSKSFSVNQRWWKYTEACQEPLPDAAAKKQFWSGMDEIFHLD